MANEFVIRKGMRLLSASTATASNMLLSNNSGNVVSRAISDMMGASGYSGASGYRGASGYSGASGYIGASGSHLSNSLRWNYRTHSTPGPTQMSMDNDTFSAATRIDLHQTCLDSSAINWCASAYNSVNGTNQSLIIKIFAEKGTDDGEDDSNHGIYLISGASYSSGVYTFNVQSVISSSGVAKNVNMVVSFVTHGQSGASGAKPTMDYYSNINWLANSTTMKVMSNTSEVMPFSMPAGISMNYVRLLASQINGANTTIASSSGIAALFGQSCLVGSTVYAVIYSRSWIGAHQLASVASGSASILYNMYMYLYSNNNTASAQIRVSYPVTGGTSSYSTQYTANRRAGAIFYTSYLSNFSGTRFFDIPLNATLSEGDYWMAIGRVSSVSTTSAAASPASRVAMSANFYGISQRNITPTLYGAASNGSVNLMYGLGSYTTNVTGTTGTIAMSKISRSSNNNMMFFQLVSNKSAT
jgi:hypothetical protein